MRHNNHTLANYLTSLAARETSPYQQIKPFKAAEMADVSCGDLEPVDERVRRLRHVLVLLRLGPKDRVDVGDLPEVAQVRERLDDATVHEEILRGIRVLADRVGDVVDRVDG